MSSYLQVGIMSMLQAIVDQIASAAGAQRGRRPLISRCLERSCCWLLLYRDELLSYTMSTTFSFSGADAASLAVSSASTSFFGRE